MVILLCLVCLTGATYALFTSDLNDGTIGIVTTSGDVEIDIVDTSGVTLQNKALLFMTTSGAADSNDILFEPGATFYTQGFKIKNTGDIPVNFSLSVSKDDKIDMEEYKTKTVVGMMKALNVENALVVNNVTNLFFVKSAANIPGVKAARVNTINTYEILKHDTLILTQDAVKELEEVYA